jgi:hypothetical protein
MGKKVKVRALRSHRAEPGKSVAAGDVYETEDVHATANIGYGNAESADDDTPVTPAVKAGKVGNRDTGVGNRDPGKL